MNNDTLVRLSDIRKSFPGKEVLKGVDLEIKDRGVLGFLGPNGAGKSTLMKIILGENEASSGEISKAQGLSIGYLPEEPSLYLHMTVNDFLAFVQSIYSTNGENFTSTQDLIIKCGLEEVRDKRIENLSKGYKQKTGIAAAICHNPKLLVLDEPMVGLDPNAIIQIKDVIRELSKNHSIFISSHQLSDLASICQEIVILNHGEIVTKGPIKEVEKKLGLSQRVYVEFENINADDLQQLSDVDFITKDRGYEFYFSDSTNTQDLRIVLTRFFAQKGMVILSQHNVKVELEDIFKMVTAKEEQR